MLCLAVDHGLKKTGLAFGDAVVKIGSPLETVPTEIAADKIKDFIKKEGIDALVVGLPYHADGSESEQGEAVKSFVDSLDVQIPVHYVDERFSTLDGQEMQGKGDSASEDSLAALSILKRFFEEYKS